jgi:hypothetical protein
MKTIRATFLLTTLFVLALGACNFPGGGLSDAEQAAAVQTSAAETVSVQLTQNAALTPSATQTPTPSETPTPSNTPAVTNTVAATSGSSGGSAGGGCDSMAFVADVTVPDGEDFAPNTAFVKTWRLRNSGTCSWSTSYSVVFSSGNSMGGPATQALASSVAPGATVDISFNLTSPASAGAYTGYWQFRNAAGQNFGSFYVQIDVTGSGGSGSSGGTTVTLNASQVGQVRSDGTVAGNAHAGDTSGNLGVQSFVAFNISSIPSGATITEVKVDFSSFDTQSNPFSPLGCLAGYYGTFFPLDAGDYVAGGSGADLQWCDSGSLATVFIDDDVKARLQSALGGTSFEYRLRFTGAETDNDGADDLVRFLSAPKLIVTYIEP